MSNNIIGEAGRKVIQERAQAGVRGKVRKGREDAKPEKEMRRKRNGKDRKKVWGSWVEAVPKERIAGSRY